MDKYKSLTRTTIAECADLPHSGIYIIAYMGRVVYVGKSVLIGDRLGQHITNRAFELLGHWLDLMRFDWANIRLDALETPDDCDEEVWNKEAEALLIRRFNPLFNTMNMV